LLDSLSDCCSARQTIPGDIQILEKILVALSPATVSIEAI
jgi:hypothetical protein